MKNNKATVQSIYEAFGKGDIPTIIDYLAENVQWEQCADNSAQQAGVPWMQARNGKQGAYEFFKTVGELEVKDFQVLNLSLLHPALAKYFYILPSC